MIYDNDIKRVKFEKAVWIGNFKRSERSITGK